jgi:hypothetical protein
MLNRIADYLIERSKKTPYFHLDGYMNRYWLVPYVGKLAGKHGCGYVSWRKRPIARFIQCFGIAVRVHEILRSDSDRHMHNHPWKFCSIILNGGYQEVTPEAGRERSKKYGAGSILFRTEKSRHRLVLNEVLTGEFVDAGHIRVFQVKPVPVTTLFITFRYVQKWGFFLDDGKFVPHDEYIE